MLKQTFEQMFIENWEIIFHLKFKNISHLPKNISSTVVAIQEFALMQSFLVEQCLTKLLLALFNKQFHYPFRNFVIPINTHLQWIFYANAKKRRIRRLEYGFRQGRNINRQINSKRQFFIMKLFIQQFLNKRKSSVLFLNVQMLNFYVAVLFVSLNY